jgi:hypothetical protein
VWLILIHRGTPAFPARLTDIRPTRASLPFDHPIRRLRALWDRCGKAF